MIRRSLFKWAVGVLASLLLPGRDGGGVRADSSTPNRRVPTGGSGTAGFGTAVPNGAGVTLRPSSSEMTVDTLAAAVKWYLDNRPATSLDPAACRELVIYGPPADDDLGRLLRGNGELLIRVRPIDLGRGGDPVAGRSPLMWMISPYRAGGTLSAWVAEGAAEGAALSPNEVRALRGRPPYRRNDA